MEKIKNIFKQILNFIKKYWFLFAMGASIILFLMIRASVSSDDKVNEVLQKSEEVKNTNKEKIKEAEQAIQEAKKSNEEIKKRKEERALSKKERDDKADDIFNIGG